MQYQSFSTSAPRQIPQPFHASTETAAQPDCRGYVLDHHWVADAAWWDLIAKVKNTQTPFS